jgi:hypothetical protein
MCLVNKPKLHVFRETLSREVNDASVIRQSQTVSVWVSLAKLIIFCTILPNWMLKYDAYFGLFNSRFFLYQPFLVIDAFLKKLASLIIHFLLSRRSHYPVFIYCTYVNVLHYVNRLVATFTPLT